MSNLLYLIPEGELMVANDNPIRYYSASVEADIYSTWINEINGLLQLDDNWDGYGARRVYPEIVDVSLQFISMLSACHIERIHDVYPNPHGTIAITWVNSEEEILSLEIGLENFSYFVKYNQSAPTLFDGNDILAHHKQISSELDLLFPQEATKVFLEYGANL